MGTMFQSQEMATKSSQGQTRLRIQELWQTDGLVFFFLSASMWSWQTLFWELNTQWCCPMSRNLPHSLHFSMGEIHLGLLPMCKLVTAFARHGRGKPLCSAAPLDSHPRYQVGAVSSQMMGTPSAGPSIFVNIKFHHVEFHHSKLIYEQYPNYPVPYSAGPLPQMAFPVLKTEFHVAICRGPIFFLRPKYFLWMWDFCLSSSPC